MAKRILSRLIFVFLSLFMVKTFLFLKLFDGLTFVNFLKYVTIIS